MGKINSMSLYVKNSKLSKTNFTTLGFSIFLTILFRTYFDPLSGQSEQIFAVLFHVTNFDAKRYLIPTGTCTRTYHQGKLSSFPDRIYSSLLLNKKRVCHCTSRKKRKKEKETYVI